MKCRRCGDEHALLDPAFRRPDVIAAIPQPHRPGRVFERDDICALRGDAGAAERYFVRGVLAVDLLDGDGVGRAGWGLWAEISGPDSAIIWKRWTDPDQSGQPPFAGTLANRIPDYPDTIGLPLSIQLTGPRTRPALAFPASCDHPFAVECRASVCVHRVHEWLRHFV